MCFGGFNHSVWNALWVLLPIGVAATLYVGISATVRRQFFYFFDAKHNTHPALKSENGDFKSHSKRYCEIATLVIALSSGAVAFLIGTWANLKAPPTSFDEKLVNVTPIVVGFFGAAVALCILFMVLQAVWYEQYCHSPSHDSYRAWKYAICKVCGYTGFLSFVLGFVWLGANLFTQ